MKKLLTLALCALSVSAFATTPSIEDQMSYPPQPPLLDFPNWWSVIAYNPRDHEAPCQILKEGDIRAEFE